MHRCFDEIRTIRALGHRRSLFAGHGGFSSLRGASKLLLHYLPTSEPFLLSRERIIRRKKLHGSVIDSRSSSLDNEEITFQSRGYNDAKINGKLSKWTTYPIVIPLTSPNESNAFHAKRKNASVRSAIVVYRACFQRCYDIAARGRVSRSEARESIRDALESNYRKKYFGPMYEIFLS